MVSCSFPRDLSFLSNQTTHKASSLPPKKRGKGQFYFCFLKKSKFDYLVLISPRQTHFHEMHLKYSNGGYLTIQTICSSTFPIVNFNNLVACFFPNSWHILMRMKIPKEGNCDPIAPLELPHSLHAFHRVSSTDSSSMVTIFSSPNFHFICSELHFAN